MTKKTSAKSTKRPKSVVAPLSVNFTMLILGVCLLIWGDQVMNIISIVLGVLSLTLAIYYLIGFGREKQGTSSNLISAFFLAAVGIFFIANPTFIKEFISYIIGFILIVSGLTSVHRAAVFDADNPKIISRAHILGLISTTAGVLAIMGRIIIPDVMLQLLGITMIIYSFSSTFSVILERDQAKKAQTPSEKSADAIEAEVVDKKKK